VSSACFRFRLQVGLCKHGDASFEKETKIS
jgi:hypothetical protein